MKNEETKIQENAANLTSVVFSEKKTLTAEERLMLQNISLRRQLLLGQLRELEREDVDLARAIGERLGVDMKEHFVNTDAWEVLPIDKTVV